MKKQCLRLFNKPLYAGLGSKQKTFSNCGVTSQKKLCLLFGNQGIFFTDRTFRQQDKKKTYTENLKAENQKGRSGNLSKTTEYQCFILNS